jgi:predicted Zn finger-like uncharacterized protein
MKCPICNEELNFSLIATEFFCPKCKTRITQESIKENGDRVKCLKCEDIGFIEVLEISHKILVKNVYACSCWTGSNLNRWKKFIGRPGDEYKNRPQDFKEKNLALFYRDVYGEDSKTLRDIEIENNKRRCDYLSNQQKREKELNEKPMSNTISNIMGNIKLKVEGDENGKNEISTNNA